jgi:(1->4)-alpha-D-glucan 1-alpha-D-glucosylmutase
VSSERRATYRLQLGPGLGFERAAELVPYLATLGVSHLYLSPCLQARPGSAHGYDVVDFRRPSAELGGETGWSRLCAAVQAHGMGVLLDIVPNHMAVGSGDNSWWWDVLENGPSSRYAAYFDIDWERTRRAEEALLLPVLGDHYGRVLEAGELSLEREGTRFCLRYGPHRFPAAPRSLPDFLAPAAERCGSALLAFAARVLLALPLPTATDRASVERRHRDKGALYVLLDRLLVEEPEVRDAVDAEVQRLRRDPDRLDAFLGHQNYRLAFWRIASRELGYRRFFDIDPLVALRVEDPGVFADTHALVLRWLEQGAIDGVRVDHIDGLRDPLAYLQRLRAARADAWIVVEKILEPSERLPADWPVDGTTGYDFLNLVGGLFVDEAGEKPLTQLYASVTGEPVDYAALLLECKRHVLDELLGSDLRRLTELLIEVCRRHRRHRDYTALELEAALRELAACLSVYRTYVREGGAAPRDVDRHHVRDAVECARRNRPDLPPDLFGFLGELLLLGVPGPVETELALRFQQLTGPAMAKGAEDTAFYRFHRLVALNEVGGDPRRFGVSPESFHAACAAASAHAPAGLLATATHDTKRGEDVRARLALLSEIPQAWADAVSRWSERCARHRRGPWPDRAAEYLLYQTLVGAWPIDAARLTAFLEKAAREAKLHTSWRAPDPPYEDALRQFASAVLADAEFRADLEAFVAPLIPAGRINSLAQTLLKLAAPGVPDLYQGAELWDLSLVDPDNRQPVDFGRAQRLLESLEQATPESVLAGSEAGLPKLWLIRKALALRARAPGLLGPGARYEPLPARGPRAQHVVAFARGGGCVALAPRLVLGLGGDWQDTRLALPAGRWTDELTGESLWGGEVRLAALLARFPVALLVRDAA